MKSPNWLTHLIVAIVALLVAVFGVFNVLFSDRNGPRDAEIAVVFVFIVNLIASVAVHLVSRRPGWTWFWWLVIPGIVLGGGFALTDIGALDWYPLKILGTMILASAIGRMAGQLRRSKSQAHLDIPKP